MPENNGPIIASVSCNFPVRALTEMRSSSSTVLGDDIIIINEFLSAVVEAAGALVLVVWSCGLEGTVVLAQQSRH